MFILLVLVKFFFSHFNSNGFAEGVGKIFFLYGWDLGYINRVGDYESYCFCT